jgi:hypothetical protein
MISNGLYNPLWSHTVSLGRLFSTFRKCHLGSSTHGTTTIQHTGHITTHYMIYRPTTTIQHTGHITTHYMIYRPFDMYFK